jgi:tRNA nucleotidyltransferase (CCA-adding enzyme)
LRQAFSAARNVDAGAIAAELARTVQDLTRLPAAINTRVSEARIAKIKSQLA